MLIEFIRKDYPDLRDESYRVVTGARQNIVIIVGERLVFRFPITSDYSFMELEKRLLPKLALRVPLPIPRIGNQSTGNDSMPFICYPIIPGDPLYDEQFAQLSDIVREQIAIEIGEFLSVLHAFKDDCETGSGMIENHLVWRKGWEAFFHEIETLVFPVIGELERLWVQQIRGELNTDEFLQFTPCLIHGDFKREHILYDPSISRISGIIDFGQLKVGDPAYDFHYMYLNFGVHFVKSVYLHYRGPKDCGFFHRIEIYTYVLWLSELLYAVQAQNEYMWKRGIEWLRASAEQGEAR